MAASFYPATSHSVSPWLAKIEVCKGHYQEVLPYYSQWPSPQVPGTLFYSMWRLAMCAWVCCVYVGLCVGGPDRNPFSYFFPCCLSVDPLVTACLSSWCPQGLKKRNKMTQSEKHTRTDGKLKWHILPTDMLIYFTKDVHHNSIWWILFI